MCTAQFSRDAVQPEVRVLYNACPMPKPRTRAGILISFALVLAAALSCPAITQQVDHNLSSGMRWRMIGPFRGGRSNAVSGIQGQPNVYYFGSVGGGVWKSTNGGETWEPIFDSQPIASIGALAIAASHSDVIYFRKGQAAVCFRLA